ncbi:MAG: sensor histidine kinase [Cytophagaceae bacterium]|nr:sensor histidine kinase [Cytophagaceae bacterium]
MFHLAFVRPTILLGYLYKLYKINQKISKKNQNWFGSKIIIKKQFAIYYQYVGSRKLFGRKLTKSTFSDIKVRLQSMALLQKSLYRKKYLSGIYIQDYLDEIIENCLLSFDDEDVLINSEIDDVYLSPEKAQSVGLILTELIINSCKHAFKNSLRGEITFNLKKSRVH